MIKITVLQAIWELCTQIRVTKEDLTRNQTNNLFCLFLSLSGKSLHPC